MPSRLQKRNAIAVYPDHEAISSLQDLDSARPLPLRLPSDAQTRAIPVPAPNGSADSKMSGSSVVSKYNIYHNSTRDPRNGSTTLPKTIRTVPSFEAPSEASSLESPSARSSGFSSSVASNASAISYYESQQLAQAELLARTKDEEALMSPMTPMTPSDSTMRPTIESAGQGLSIQAPDSSLDDHHVYAGRDVSPSGDLTIGKAGLGKTGRVINKLVSDNETLKRELKIERLRAEESKSTAKLMEDKMERMISEYESRLLEANVNKTLLSRKERQVEHLQSMVELEKKRAGEAQERERTWREELSKNRQESSVQVDEARAHAMLMEGRYNAISSHWRTQGEEVDRAVDKMSTRIVQLAEERRQDDEKITVLRDICDQQDGNIRDLRRQKEAIAASFEAYKREQEEMLREIKRSARAREEEQARTVAEAKEVLQKLKWALNVKENVRDAQ